MNIYVLQGIVSENPFDKANAIYVIDDYVVFEPDNNLPQIQMPANCILRFTGKGDPNASAYDNSPNNGRGLLRGKAPFQLIGNNTLIEAGMFHIFDESVGLSGSFTNAEWPAEWWGAKSDGSDAAPAINRALQQIANTDKQGTLLLANRYEVRDTIYMQPGVAISGVDRNFTHKSSVSKMRGILEVNFQGSYSQNWVIDTLYANGDEIDFNRLYAGYDEEAEKEEYKSRFNDKYVGCCITNLRIANKVGNTRHVFGGIRLHSMQYGKIHDVDIEAQVFIGLALVGKVWTTSLRNLYMRAYGCPLYLGRACTTLTASNVTLHGCETAIPDYPFVLKKADNESQIETILEPNTLPPYWDATRMRSCGIIMENKSHCTFTGCTVEHVDAVICGTDYIAKFISPYIEKIHYTFGWLYASTNYSIPNHRYELIVEDMVSGFETFPSMEMENGEYKYLKKVNYYDIIPPPVIDPQAEGNRDSTPVARDGNLAVVSEKWVYLFYPTFGTVRGVVRAFNVGRATCWEDNAANAETWNYPSYFIHVSPGLQQRSFYYDHYLFVQEKETDGGGAVVNESTWLEDVRYCKYKKIIVEQNDGPVRYFYHHVHDIGGSETNDNKVIWDIYKRQLQLGVSHNIATLSGEMFVRNLDNFIMTPLSASSKIDYGGIVKRKKFTIEIINAANAIQFAQPLHLHNCEITFKNSRDGLAAFADTATNTNPDGLPYLLGLSGDCVVNFVGGFNSWGGALGKLIKLMGSQRVKLQINLTNNTTGLSFSNPGNYIVNYSTFVPGCDVEVDEI